MDVCRVCLSVGPDKHIYQLTLSHEDCTVEYPVIIGLCFNNEYLEQKMKFDGLCTECYDEILRFYKFKSKALKNDAYIRSIEPDIVEIEQAAAENKNPLIESEEFSEANINILQNEEAQNTIPCQIDASEIKYEYSVDDLKNEDVLDMRNTDETALDMENSVHSDDEESSTPASPAETDSDTSDESSDDNAAVSKHRPVDSDPDPDFDPRKKDSLKWKRKPKVPKPVKKIKDYCEQSVKPRTCRYCREMFSDTLAMRRHKKKVHYNVKVFCHICLKEVTRDKLKSHIILAHEREKLKECKTCCKKFILQLNLDRHECKGHQGRRIRKRPDKPAVRPHGCTLCDKRFMTPESLQYHMKNKHENKHNYLCQYCSKGFAKMAPMKIHIRSHTKEKPYKCDDCGAAFATPHNLQFHQHSHKTTREYQCHICLKLYKNPSYVARHIQKNHTGQCRYCSEQFTTPDDRRAHEKKTHANETPFGLINGSSIDNENNEMPPPKKLLSREEILEKKRENERKRYARIKSDPAMFEAFKQKLQLKYSKQKTEMKIKLVSQMSEREKRHKRKYWSEASKKYRQKKRPTKLATDTFVREHTPSSLPNETSIHGSNPQTPQILSPRIDHMQDFNLNIASPGPSPRRVAGSERTQSFRRKRNREIAD